jgi:integrase
MTLLALWGSKSSRRLTTRKMRRRPRKDGSGGVCFRCIDGGRIAASDKVAVRQGSGRCINACAFPHVTRSTPPPVPAISHSRGSCLKTRTSHRTVPLWPQLATVLQEYLASEYRPDRPGLLFPSDRTDGMITDSGSRWTRSRSGSAGRQGRFVPRRSVTRTAPHDSKRSTAGTR